MFVITNRIPVAQGHEEEFEERFRNRAHLIDQSPGFVKNLVLRPVQRRFNHKTGRLEEVVRRLSELPPLVTSWEVERLKGQLAEASGGRRFLLQGEGQVQCPQQGQWLAAAFDQYPLRLALQQGLGLLAPYALRLAAEPGLHHAGYADAAQGLQGGAGLHLQAARLEHRDEDRILAEQLAAGQTRHHDGQHAGHDDLR